MKTKEVEELRSRGVEEWKDQEPTANVALGPQARRCGRLLDLWTPHLLDCKSPHRKLPGRTPTVSGRRPVGGEAGE